MYIKRLIYEGGGEMSEELVIAAQRGNESAFAELMLPLEKKLYCTAMSVVGNRHDAEDAWQNTVLKAWQQIKRLQNPKLYKLWITRILLNEATTILRKRARTPVPQEHMPETAAPMQDMEQFMVVQQYLRLIPENQRQAVVLRYWLDLSLDEIALALDVPLSTAKTRLYQGMKTLSEKLRKEEAASE